MSIKGYYLLLACDDYIYYYKGDYYAANNERWDFYNRYLRVFERLRIACRVVASTTYKESWVLLPENQIDVVYIKEFHGPLQYAKSYRCIGRQLSGVTESIDAAVIRLPSTIAERVGRLVKKQRIPYAVEVVYNTYESYKSTINPFYRLLEYIIHRKTQELCLSADGVSCVTEFELQKHYYSKKSDAFVSHYSSLALNQDYYLHNRAYPDKPVMTIAHVSNEVCLDSRKGHKMIIDVLSKIKEDGIIVNVNFAGKDYNNGINKIKEYAQLKGVEDQVYFAGYLSRVALKHYLEESDLFVFPTRAEGLPRVLIEAMSQGLPCLGSDISGNRELLGSEYLFDLNRIMDLSEKIKKLIADRTHYEDASEKCFNTSLSYEASILEKRRDSFYSQLKKRIQ